MAIMHPDLTLSEIEQIESNAEAKLYKLFKECLPNDFEVFFSISWILKYKKGPARDGEADFIITHPKLGFLVIEVKGGGISYDSENDHWSSIDRFGTKHGIKDPVKQGLNAKYSILAKYKEHPNFRRLQLSRILCGHAVFFPDIDSPNLIRQPDLPKELIGTYSHLENLNAWVNSVFSYWQGTDATFNPITKQGINLFINIFSRSFEVLPLLSAELQDNEKKRIKLTNEQARILDLLMSKRRVAISGGAGTGKSLLAVEKAQRLAKQGFKTLLTCFNRPLAEYLAESCKGIENLDVVSFHQLCHHFIKKAGRVSGRDLLAEAKSTYPGKDLWRLQYPNALAYALEILDERYDAIICDEGQDFEDDFWFPLEMLLADFEDSPFYIFFDENQNIYSLSNSFPIKEAPFYLTVNCRNTDKIHDIAYKFYKGIKVDAPEIIGQPVQTIEENTLEKQAQKIQQEITKLISEHGVKAKDIVVLIINAKQKNNYYEKLKQLPIPKPATWQCETYSSENVVLIDTVNRFKGLESPIVFLWAGDNAYIEDKTSSLYVGLSRAKSHLILVGSNQNLTSLL